MPRPYRKKHVLRTTREILGLSQVELAKRVGVAPITITKIENHVIAMSEDVASRISMLTGVDQEQLIANSNPAKPEIWIGIKKSTDGRYSIVKSPLTKKEFETARDSNLLTREKVDFWLQFHTFRIQILLDACVTSSPEKYHALSMALVSAIARVANKEFNLHGTTQKLLQKFTRLNENDDQATTREKMSAQYVSPILRAKHYAELEEGRRVLKKAVQGTTRARSRKG
jgi:transcriptional regulator with XRE-family HTH domain